MKHLTDEQLSAYLDLEMLGRDAEEAARHLAACQPCREALAEMAAQDESLFPVLRHDPGEAYFESFARRVGDRIRSAGLAGVPQRGGGFDLGRFFRSPRALAWTGAVAVVVVGGGLALMTMREGLPPQLRDREADRLMERSAPAAGQPASPPSTAAPPTAPPPTTMESASPSDEAAGAPAEQEALRAPAPGAAAPAPKEERGELKAMASSPADERAASPSRAMEVRRTESGEDVPVRRKDGPVPAPAPSAAGAVGAETQVRKKTQAELLQKQSVPTPTTSSVDAGSAAREATPSPAFAAPPPPAASPANAKTRSTAEGEVRVCGDVRDAQGRPIVGAQVVASDLGRGVRADAEGRFCLSLPPGEHPVSVMAVGYTATRRTLRTGEGEAHLTLAAVPVLEGDHAASTKRMAAPAEPADPFSGLPDSLRGPVREAQRLEADAAARRFASGFDAAALAWERSLASLKGGPLEVETRRHLATARYRAWELAPTAARARSAAGALDAYLALAPAGPERAQAAAWRDQVRP